MAVTEEDRDLVARALAEDVGKGDLTAEALVPPDVAARGRILQKEPGVIFGLELAAEAFAQVGEVRLESRASEAEWRDDVPAEVATLTGPARAILTAERTALNFLAHLSGVATVTARFVAAGAGATILDTRKTTPGLRRLEKAAVAAGGGMNHRMGLHDAILIKENHSALAGGIARAVARARDAQPGMAIEVEVRDAEEVREGLAARANRLLLDNMELAALRAAVAARDEAATASGHRAELEASGGVSLATVAGIAEAGVDFISVGALTHSAPALDLSLLLEPS